MMLGRGEAHGVRIFRPETVELMTSDRLTAAQRAILVRDEPHWVGEGFGLGVGIDIDAERRARYGEFDQRRLWLARRIWDLVSNRP